MRHLEAAPERSRAMVATRPTRESLKALRALRESFLLDPQTTDLAGLRDVIARSWHRSVACNVNPLSVAYETREAQIDEPFLRIAMPIVNRLADIAADTGVCVILADASGTMATMRGDKDMIRWADARFNIAGAYMPEDLSGTNSDGTAIEEGIGVQVWGPEHFAEGLQETFCTSVPIRGSAGRKITAVLTLMAPQRIALETDPGSLALLVESAAAEIGRQSAARHARREEALLQAYLHESRMRGADAVLALDDRTTIASNRAQQILTRGDYAVLTGYAQEAGSRRSTLEQVISLDGDRPIKMTAKPVLLDEDEVVGAVVRLSERGSSDGSAVSWAGAPVDSFPDLIGTSSAMSEVRRLASAALWRQSILCLTGERGTGRSLLARLIASAGGGKPAMIECDSARRKELMSCIDEWRRALDSGEPIIGLHADQLDDATVQQIRDAIRVAVKPGRIFLVAYQVPRRLIEGLAGFVTDEIKLPPLRSRRDDIPALVSRFLSQCGARGVTPTPKLLGALARADWPGNVADLRDVVQSAGVRVGGSLCVSDLGELQRNAIAQGRLTRLEAGELEQIRHALAEAQGNRVRAAQILEIGRSTLYRKIDSYTRRGFDLGV